MPNNLDNIDTVLVVYGINFYINKFWFLVICNIEGCSRFSDAGSLQYILKCSSKRLFIPTPYADDLSKKPWNRSINSSSNAYVCYVSPSSLHVHLYCRITCFMLQIFMDCQWLQSNCPNLRVLVHNLSGSPGSAPIVLGLWWFTKVLRFSGTASLNDHGPFVLVLCSV